jgi:hypothetical protein
MLTADGDSVRLVVDRPYKAGEPIIVWYYVFLQLHNCINIHVLPHDILQSECSQLVRILCIVFGTCVQDLKLCRLCRCGPQTNSRLVLNYGFVDEDNPFDRIAIEVNNLYYAHSSLLSSCVTLTESRLQASLNTEDPQFQEKRMVAQRNGKLAFQNFNVSFLPPFVVKL